MLVATNEKGHVVFLVIYKKQSVFDGPHLKDLPTILDLFQQNKKIILKDVLNLDGGSASAFYTEGFKLKEIKPLGSYFCVTQ